MYGIANTSIKPVKMFRIITGLVILSALFSCNTSQNGPCEWRPEVFVQMRVVDIDTLSINPLRFEVWLEFNKSILGHERQAMSKLRDIEISESFIQANKIKRGIIYTGYVNERLSGNCSPYYLSWSSEFITPENE